MHSYCVRLSISLKPYSIIRPELCFSDTVHHTVIYGTVCKTIQGPCQSSADNSQLCVVLTTTRPCRLAARINPLPVCMYSD